MARPELKEFVELMVERRMREVDVTGGKRVPFGSDKHIRDLIERIEELEGWRSKQKRGTEARANYSRLISKLKSELLAAKRAWRKKFGEK